MRPRSTSEIRQLILDIATSLQGKIADLEKEGGHRSQDAHEHQLSHEFHDIRSLDERIGE
jgi:hypothetical protein